MFWVFSIFFSFRRQTFERFGQLFDEVEITQNEGTAHERRITTEKRYKSKWGWYAVLYNLSGGDVLKIEPVTKIKIYEALTFLSYQQDLFILEKERHGTKF